jgi:poly [ADP-ribose] polymerase 6/8
MKTEHQYMFLSSPPEKESKFQELKKKKGSFWAFHGSPFANWHSILRVGLKNYSSEFSIF